MRNKIQQLAQQARLSIPPGTLGVDEWIEVYNQRFGELIVRECAQLADTAEPFKANDLILSHFGVQP